MSPEIKEKIINACQSGSARDLWNALFQVNKEEIAQIHDSEIQKNALYYACASKKDSCEKIKILVEKGLTINPNDDEALFLALQANNHETVRYLIENYDFNKKIIFEDKLRDKYINALKCLFQITEFAAEVNHQNKKWKSLLFRAIKKFSYEDLKENDNKEIISFLFERATDYAREIHNDGIYLLFLSEINTNDSNILSGLVIEAVRSLFRNKPFSTHSNYLKARDFNGNTALMLAAKRNRLSLLYALKEYCHMPEHYLNETNKHGQTAIHYAAIATKKHVALKESNKKSACALSLLLDCANIDPFLQNGKGDFPIHLAIRLIQKAGKDDNEAKHHSEQRKKNIKILLKHYEKKPGLSLTEHYNQAIMNTALHEIVIERDLKTLNQALELKKLNMNINVRNRKGETPLILTATGRNAQSYEIAQKLLEHKADINHYTIYGQSTLHYAAHNKNIAILKLLCDHENLNIDLQDNNGDTALMKAIRNNDIEAIKLLLEKGASIDPKNNKMEDAIAVAYNNYSNADDHQKEAFKNPEEIYQLILTRQSEPDNSALLIVHKDEEKKLTQDAYPEKNLRRQKAQNTRREYNPKIFQSENKEEPNGITPLHSPKANKRYNK